MNREVWLTTVDNPYDPFSEREEWFMFDSVVMGYNTSAYIARIALVSDSMTDAEISSEIERAVDQIVEYDFMNMYRKVAKAG